jgi:hypothetical protein
MKTPQKKVIRTIIWVTILVLLPFLGFILGKLVAGAYTEGTFSAWHSLAKPDWNISDILGGDPWTVWLQADDGQIYEGNIQKCKDIGAECWKESENFDTSYVSEIGPTCQSRFANLKNPPAGVLKCMRVLNLGAEWYGETLYVLLTDGSVWYWVHSVSGLGPNGILSIQSCMICGITLFGVLLMIFLIINTENRNS